MSQATWVCVHSIGGNRMDTKPPWLEKMHWNILWKTGLLVQLKYPVRHLHLKKLSWLTVHRWFNHAKYEHVLPHIHLVPVYRHQFKLQNFQNSLHIKQNPTQLRKCNICIYKYNYYSFMWYVKLLCRWEFLIERQLKYIIGISVT